MKIPVSTIQVLDAPLDVWTEVSRHETGDEPVHLCDLTDVVRKYIKWTKLLPRVVPFYGKTLYIILSALPLVIPSIAF